MAERNNLKEVIGVIFAKPVETFTYKKGEKKGQPGERRYIILEIRDGSGNQKEYIDFHKFKITNPSVPLDDFDVGERVVISYALGGQEWQDKFINETKAVYIKHADIQGNDTRDLRPQKPKKQTETVFVVPDPSQPKEDDDDLPF